MQWINQAYEYRGIVIYPVAADCSINDINNDDDNDDNDDSYDSDDNKTKNIEEIKYPERIIKKYLKLKYLPRQNDFIKSKHREIETINNAICSNEKEKLIRKKIISLADSYKSTIHTNIKIMIKESVYINNVKIYNLLLSKINCTELQFIEYSFFDYRKIIKYSCIKTLIIYVLKSTTKHFHTTNKLKELHLLSGKYRNGSYTDRRLSIIKIIKAHYITNSVNLLFIDTYTENNNKLIFPNSIKYLHVNNDAKFPFKPKYLLFSGTIKCGIKKKSFYLN
jgi:hypothetical protein